MVSYPGPWDCRGYVPAPYDILNDPEFMKGEPRHQGRTKDRMPVKSWCVIDKSFTRVWKPHGGGFVVHREVYEWLWDNYGFKYHISNGFRDITDTKVWFWSWKSDEEWQGGYFFFSTPEMGTLFKLSMT